MRCYQLSPHVYLETFDEEAVLLVADRNLMVTVNHAAAQLFEQAAASVGGRAFRRSDCVDFLLDHFEMSRPAAEQRMRAMLGFALKYALVIRTTVADAEPL